MGRYALLAIAATALLASTADATASRRREVLEAFPLEALRYVKREVTPTGIVAIIVDPDGVSHRVVIGNLVGQDNGKITVIKEAEILLIEVRSDGIGGWYEHLNAMPLTP